MAKDQIDRADGVAASDVAANSKKQEVAALLKKLKVEEEVAGKDGETESAFDPAAPAQEVATTEGAFAADGAYEVAQADTAGTAGAGAAAGAAAGTAGGMSTGTMLALGGVVLVGGGVAIASNGSGGGGNDGPSTPKPYTAKFNLTVAPTSVTEGANGTKQMTFTLTLDKAPAQAITVSYSTQTTGTAIAGSDFVAETGSVTFAAGQAAAQITISVIGDTRVEGDETVNVTFSSSNTVAPVVGTGTILNDDVVSPGPGGGIDGAILTLKEVVIPGEAPTPPETRIYWGYTPNDENEDGTGGGVPVEAMIDFLKTITGLDLFELGLIDDDGVGPFDNVTSLNISNALSIDLEDNDLGDDEQPVITINYNDGTSRQFNIEAQISEQYFKFLNDLLFDSEGNSRLYEVEVPGTGSPGYDPSLAAIRLTPNENNGATIEGDALPTTGNDLIVAGRVELLHQAYIDGGAGRNVLEIDAKGTYAQPTALLNIQEVRINDLPNFYTDDDFESGIGNGNLGNTNIDSNGFPIPNGDGSDDTWIDLNRALSLDKLVITDQGNADSETSFSTSGEGSLSGFDGYSGDLTVVGVRNAATLRLEGGFSSGDTTIQYGFGQTGTLDVELAVGTVDAAINILQNASVIRIDSQGVENNLQEFFLGGNISRMIVTGDAVLGIQGDLGDSFNANRPAVIDASANTGGVDLNVLDNVREVRFLSSAGEDDVNFFLGESALGITKITVDGQDGDGHYDLVANAVYVDLGNGDNVIHAGELFDDEGEADDRTMDTAVITVGNGRNTIDAIAYVAGENAPNPSPEANVFEDTQSSITIIAGNGGNDINAWGDFVNVTTGSGNDEVNATGREITVNTGGGNDVVTIFGNNEDFEGSSDTILIDEEAITSIQDGVLLNINLGTGTNTLVLGAEIPDSIVQPIGSVTALTGSVITGSNITLVVNETSDLREASLTGITRVLLDNNNFGTANAVQLTITADQFSAIGAAAFDVDFAAFGAAAQIKVIITEDTTLSDLVTLADLSPNVRLNFEIYNDATLTLTAEELHTYVATDGITVFPGFNGNVVINNAGPNFDPFQDVAGGLNVGSLNNTVLTSDDVVVNRTPGGFERDLPDPNVDELVITNTDLVNPLVVGPIDLSGPQNVITDLILNGGGAFDFSTAGPILLPNNFLFDFSEAGAVTSLTIGNFDVITYGLNGGDPLGTTATESGLWGEIIGNGLAGQRIDFHLNEDVGDADDAVNGGFVSSGVEIFVATDLNGEDRSVATCVNTQDITTLGLQGNFLNTLTYANTERGIDFLMEVVFVKDQGYVVGSLVADFAREGGTAVVNVVGVDALPAGEVQLVAGIDVTDAVSSTINVVGGDTIIQSFDASEALVDLILTADADLEMSEQLPDDLASVDASGVVGTLTVEIDVPSEGENGPLEFIGAAGGTELTIEDAGEGTIGSIDGAGVVNLTIGNGTGTDNVDLSETTLGNIGTVTLNDNVTLALTLTQANAIGPANFVLADGADNANLALEDLNEEPFAIADYAEGIAVAIVTVIDQPVVTLNPLTDLTGVGMLMVHEGTVLNLTAAQFQQLNGAGTIAGVDGTTDFTVNITDLMQADADLDGGLNLSGVTADNKTITLAESVDLTSDLGDVDNDDLIDDLGGFDVNIGDGFTLTLDDVTQGDGINFIGTGISTLQFNDLFVGPFDSIDASGFGVTNLRITNLLVANRNVDLIFTGLPQSVTKVIFNDLGFVEGVTQTVVLEEGSTVPGFVVFNTPVDEVEIQDFILNLEGGTEISGNLRLSSTEKVDDDGVNLIKTHLQTVVINSNGDAEATNLLTGDAVNIIAGNLTSQGTGLQPSTPPYNSVDNNLLDITINGTQDFILEGDIIFESVTNDDNVTANDDDEASASLVVNNAGDTFIGGINTDDDDVDALDVVNNGTGTLTVKINGDDIDQESLNPSDDGDDALSFTGTGAINLIIDPTVDLSDDILDAVTQITINDDGTLILSQAQLDAIGIGNLLDDGSNTLDGATLNLVEFGSDPFDATLLDPGIDLDTITMQAGNITLDPTTNLTDVDQIIVQEGSTLTLSVTQFQQLLGDGSIVGVDADGMPSTDFTVNLTGLTQDNVNAEDGLVLTGIASENITLTLAENVNLIGSETLSLPYVALEMLLGLTDPSQVADLSVTALGNLDNLTVILADGQELGLGGFEQADGLNVNGGAPSTVIYQFTDLQTDAFGMPPVQIDASGYNITDLRALAASFTVGGAANVEFSIDDLPSAVTLTLYESTVDLGFLDPTFRIVVIEEGITTPTGLIFNDWDADDEVRRLDLTLEGDVELNGNLSFPTRTDKDPSEGVQQYFELLTINSVGALPNLIDGNINTATVLGAPNTSENNLLDIIINADQDLDIEGDIVFNGQTSLFPDDDAVANLTINGTADVTVHQLIVTDAEINVLNVSNNGTGNLVVTGESPAIDDSGEGTLEEIYFFGTGNVTLGDTDTNSSDETGVSGSAISLIDASGMSGDLYLGEIIDIDSADFSLIAGSGATFARLSANDLDSTGVDMMPGNADDTAGWNIDYTAAGVGSEFHLGGGSNGPFAPVAGSILNINMGPNGVLFIDESMDLSDLDLDINSVQDIVLADGVTLTLTAEQADGLNIVAGADTGLPGFTGVVNIVDLGDTPVDLGGIAPEVAGTVSLEDDDVTLDPGTIIGNLTILLLDVAGDNNSLAGQTIRFTTADQAASDIDVIDLAPGGTSSTNVVWLFTNIDAPVDTAGYDDLIGRVFFTEALIANEGGAVENLFTTLPNPILRIAFPDLSALNVLLDSVAINRTVEFEHFTSVGDLSFSDVGATPDEFIQTLRLDLGGQVTIGNIAIDDVIGGANINPASVDFNGLIINSFRAIRTGDLLATEQFVNDNDGINELKSNSDLNALVGGDQLNPALVGNENSQPSNINTIGDIGVGGGSPEVDLDLVTINTGLVTVIGDSSGQQGAAVDIGTITYDRETVGGVSLNVTGDNDINIASVVATDAQIIGPVTVTTAGFNGTLTAPGASPAFNLGTNTVVQNVESLVFTGGNSNSTLTITADQIDNDNEFLEISYVLNGSLVTPPLSVNLVGIDVTDEDAVATAVAAALDALAEVAAVAVGNVVTVTPVGSNSFQVVNVASVGTQETIGATFSDGTTVELGSPANAGVVGDDLSSINASTYGGTLNLGVVALIDGSDDLAQDFNGDGDTVDPNEGANNAFTFTAGTGLTTLTLGMANGFAPSLETGSTWSFDLTNAAEGSALTITSDVGFDGDPGDTTSLLVSGGELILTDGFGIDNDLTDVTITLTNTVLTVIGEVDLTEANFSTNSEIIVAEDQVLRLTLDQVAALTANVTGSGTVIIEGEVDTDAPVTLMGLGFIRTANIDLSEITNAGADPQANDIAINLNILGAISDEGDAVGINVIGTDFNDEITGSDESDTFTMGAGDDAIDGNDGDDTFNVDEGIDIIVDLNSEADDMDPMTDEENDVLVVSSGAEAVADLFSGNNRFIATAETVNDGIASISGDDFMPLDVIIDVSAAGGDNGFTITGLLYSDDSNDTLIGSEQDDVINGGNMLQTVAAAADVLTGNGGDDLFVFDIATSDPTDPVETEQVAAVDAETITVTADVTDDDNESITITYVLNGVASAIIIDNDPALDVTDANDVAAAIALALDAVNGIEASAMMNVVTVTGDDGNSVEFAGLAATIGGTVDALDATYGEGTDVAQVTDITIQAPVVTDEIYTLLVTLAEGQNIGVQYTAMMGDDETDVAAGLAAAFEGLNMGMDVEASNMVGTAVITLTDLIADDGGFTVTAQALGAVIGSGASALGAADLTTADVVTDFESGDDTITFGLDAGEMANYLELEEQANYAAALMEANDAMDGAVIYFLTSTAADGGLLFFDGNSDGDVDGVVALTGITEDNFAFTDIV